MPPSIRRWLGSAMADLLSPSRPRPSGQPVHVRYEAAGQTLPGPPVPWCADAVVVELALKLPPAARTRSDFVLRLPGREPVAAEAIRKDDADDRVFRVFFRLPTPAASGTAEVLWKHRLIAPVPLPIQTADQFLTELKLDTPTVNVQLGGRSVAAGTFVGVQCRGMTAAAVLRSPTPLAPLADLGVSVVFRSERTRAEHVVPVPLTASQLASKEALVFAASPKPPRRAGEYSVTWKAGERPLVGRRVAAVSAARFAQSLRVSDARFMVSDEPGVVRATRHPPAAGATSRVGPCFAVASREAGAAGIVELEVTAQSPGNAKPPTLLAGEVLVTDGPTPFAPGLLDPADAAALSGFELRHNGRVIGVLSFRPVPTAGFTAEGGFKPPPDFAWTPSAEDELTERLTKLMRQDDPPYEITAATARGPTGRPASPAATGSSSRPRSKS